MAAESGSEASSGSDTDVLESPAEGSSGSSRSRRFGSRASLYATASVLAAVIVLGGFFFQGWVLSGWWHLTSGSSVTWDGRTVELPFAWRLERQSEGSLVLASASGEFLAVQSVGGAVDPVVWAQSYEARFAESTELVSVAGHDAVEFGEVPELQWMVAPFGDLVLFQGESRDAAAVVLDRLYANASPTPDSASPTSDSSSAEPTDSTIPD